MAKMVTRGRNNTVVISVLDAVDDGGNGGGYQAQAVHFDGSAYLSTASLTAAASIDQILYSRWCKIPDDQYTKFFFLDPEAGWFTDDEIIDTPLKTRLRLYSTVGETLNATNLFLPVDTWFHILVAARTNLPGKVLQIYINDAPASFTKGDLSPAFTMTFNGLPLFILTDSWGTHMIGDFADFWFAPGQYVDISVEENRRLFIDADGKPVDPAVATAALGTPCILFSGDAASFATNQGSGGAFTLTGTLTDASSSPSD
jgi:hypothetical protein